MDSVQVTSHAVTFTLTGPYGDAQDHIRVNADFDKHLSDDHREDFRDPSVPSLSDDDVATGAVIIDPPVAPKEDCAW